MLAHEIGDGFAEDFGVILNPVLGTVQKGDNRVLCHLTYKDRESRIGCQFAFIATFKFSGSPFRIGVEPFAQLV